VVKGDSLQPELVEQVQGHGRAQRSLKGAGGLLRRTLQPLPAAGQDMARCYVTMEIGDTSGRRRRENILQVDVKGERTRGQRGSRTGRERKKESQIDIKTPPTSESGEGRASVGGASPPGSS